MTANGALIEAVEALSAAEKACPARNGLGAKACPKCGAGLGQNCGPVLVKMDAVVREAKAVAAAYLSIQAIAVGGDLREKVARIISPVPFDVVPGTPEWAKLCEEGQREALAKADAILALMQEAGR